MIKDRTSKFMNWVAAGIAEPWVLSHFDSVKINGELSVKQDQSCMMLMNHYSHNDGGVLHRVCRTILKKKFKAMVVESQFKEFPILKYFGCFSVDKKSRNMLESLNYSVELLKDPDVMLGIYPQGGLFSLHLNKIHFVSGLDYIFKRSENTPFQVFFGVTLLDYLDSFKPTARVYLTEYLGERNTAQMEESYNQFYSECKQKHQRMFSAPERVVDGYEG